MLRFLLSGVVPGWEPVRRLLDEALKAGLRGVAILSRDGAPLALNGELARAGVAKVRFHAALSGAQDRKNRLQLVCAGELAVLELAGQVVILGIAARGVFLLAVAEPGFQKAERVVRALREDLELSLIGFVGEQAVIRCHPSDLPAARDRHQPDPSCSGRAHFEGAAVRAKETFGARRSDSLV